MKKLHLCLMSIWCFVLLFANYKSIAARGPVDPPKAGTAQPLLVAGYLANYAFSKYNLQNLTCLDRIYYFSITPDEKGTFVLPEEDAKQLGLLQSKLNAKQQLYLVVGGWKKSENISLMANTPAKRKAYIEDLVSFCAKNHLKGVDLDWEDYPSQVNAELYTALVQELSEALHKKGMALTVALGIAEKKLELAVKIDPYVDEINIMSYGKFDAEGNQAPMNLFTQWLNDYVAKGIKKEKLIAGVPFYGMRKKETTDNSSREMTYAAIAEESNPGPSVNWYGKYAYNGVQSIKEKTQYLLQNGFKGIMAWELSQDKPVSSEGSLLKAMYGVGHGQDVSRNQGTIPDSIKEVQKMQWFADAKLGVFIHWGIYAVKGVTESHSFFNKSISYKDYMDQLSGFTGAKYDPQAWADLIKESGARYAVITTKHHDGVSLWDTKLSHLNVAEKTPFHKDAIGPFFTALRKDGIKCGAYFSHIDWSYPDYTGFLKDSFRYVAKDDTARWKRFQDFEKGQLAELSDRYHPDLFWFDGGWEHSPKEWDCEGIYKLLVGKNPNVVNNARLLGYGDYGTPEQHFPIPRPASSKMKWWEMCLTTNNSWGFQFKDSAWKTPYQVITIFVDAVANGGNLLLDMGPKADGSIPKEQINVLKELGKWNKRNGEAIFNTIGGIPEGHFYGPTTLSKDSSTLYLFLQGKTNGDVMLKGIVNKIKSITALGSNTALNYTTVGKVPWVYIHVPAAVNDEYVTAVKVQLDGPVKLYRSDIGAPMKN